MAIAVNYQFSIFKLDTNALVCIFLKIENYSVVVCIPLKIGN